MMLTVDTSLDATTSFLIDSGSTWSNMVMAFCSMRCKCTG